MPKNILRANISKLTHFRPQLILDAEALSGVSSITVQSILGAAINQLLLFREPGSERAEIVATHSATAPSGNTVTLASALVESHPTGTVVYIIPWNQVRFYSAPTAVDANADASTLVALAGAQNIDPTMLENIYTDTTASSGYFYYRFSDSVNSVNDIYSDPIPYATQEIQYLDDEVGYLLDFVQRKLAHQWDERFSKQTALDEVNACLLYMQGELKNWSNYFNPDYVLGQTARGVFDFALPSTIYDSDTNKAVLQVRLATADNPLMWKDEKEFDQIMGNVAHTQVRTATSVGGVTVEVDNSFDLDDAGSVNIYTSNAVDAITYTAVTRSATAGILTGVPASGSGAIGAIHAIDTDVWQGEQEGEPMCYNIRNGRLRIWPLASSLWVNKNVLIDFYEEVTKVDSESDTIDSARRDAVKHWLLWQGKNYWRNNGTEDLKDGDFLLFQNIVKKAIRTHVSGQRRKMRPKINQISYRSSRRTNFDGS